MTSNHGQGGPHASDSHDDSLVGVVDAIASLSVEDVLAALRRAPMKARNDLLKKLRLPEMRSPTPQVSRQALQRLQRKSPHFQMHAAEVLASRVLVALDSLAEILDAPEGGENDVDDENAVRELLASIRQDTPTGILLLGLALALAQGHRLAGAIEGLLREDAELGLAEWTGATDAGEMSDADVAPISDADRLSSPRRTSDDGQGSDPPTDTSDEALREALAVELNGLLTDGPAAHDEDPDVARCRERIQGLRLEDAQDAAERILESVYAGAPPDATDLATLDHFRSSLHAVVVEVEDLVGYDVDDVTVTALQDALDVYDARRPGDTRQTLQRLCLLEGPAALEELVAAVRTAAVSAVDTEDGEPIVAGLVALAQLIDAVHADEADEGRLMQLDENARRTLPVEMHAILMSAARGRLQLPRPEELSDTLDGLDHSGDPAGSITGVRSAVLNPVDTQFGEENVAAEADGASPPASATDAPPSSEFDALPSTNPTGHALADPAENTTEIESEAAEHTDRDGDSGVASQESYQDQGGHNEQREASHVEPEVVVSGRPPDHGSTDLPADAPSARWASDQRVQAAAALLLQEARFGLTSWLAESSGAPPGTVAALRLTAYAHAMRTASGECAGRFGEIAAGLPVRDLDEGVARLLILVSAVRGALLAPFSPAAQVLDEVASLFVSPHLSAMAEIVRQGALRGVQIANVSDVSMASAASLEADIADAVDLARESLRTGPTRTIKFQRGTEIWHDWIAPAGLLGSLLSVVAADRRGERVDVAQRVLDLRSPKTLDRHLDEADRRHKSSSARSAVVAGARIRLLERANDVLDQVSSWLEYVEQLNAQRHDESDREWQLKPVSELRSRLLPHRDGVLSELEMLASDQDYLAPAAAIAARRSLTDTFALFDGVPLPGEELPPSDVLNLELLKVAEVRLNGLSPLTPVPVDGILDVAAGRDWIEAYELRERAGDHGATALIIEALRAEDPAAATALARRRNDVVAADEERLKTEIRHVRDDLARARRQGFVDDNAWSDLGARLETVSTSTDQDFGALRKQLDALGHRLQAVGDEATVYARQQLEVLAVQSERVHTVAPRIAALIDEGHLATADEFLALVEAGDDLPTADIDQPLLGEFWPAIVERLAESPLSAQAADSAASGAKWQDDLDFSELPPTRRDVVSKALRAWSTYAAGNRSSKYAAGFREVLALAGLEADGEARPQGVTSNSQRVWLDLTGVRRLGKALVPNFGTLSGGRNGDLLRVLITWGQPSAASLTEVIDLDTSRRPVVVLYFGVLDQRERTALVDIARRRKHAPVAVVDDAVVCYLATRPESRFDSLMGIVLPFTAINPYMPRVAGDVPVEMFYGRTDEIHEITDPLGTSFIYGGRQLGKSSLLRAAARRFDDGSTQRAFYVDLKREGIGRTRRPDDVWEVLWTSLSHGGVLSGKLPSRDVGSRLMAGVHDWLSTRSERRILLLLDECDEFLEVDAAQGFPTVSRLKGLLEDTARRCKPVFAGLHQVQRFQHIPNQPLAHLGRPVSVGPLRPKAAFDLVDLPLRALGYQFVNEELINRVLAYCNNQPSLIQLFGEALVNDLIQSPVLTGQPPYPITENDIESVYASRALIDDFRHRFELTLQLDPRYKVIAYAMAYDSHELGPTTVIDPVELRRDCERWWPKGFAGLSSDEFRALLGEMVGLGVLAEVDGGFRMRSPNVLRMLGTSDQIAERLLDAETYALPEPFEAASFRRPLPDTVHRSPLNEAQLAELLTRRNQCRVIASSAALGSGDLMASLKAATPRDDSISAVTIRGRSIPAAQARPIPGKHRLVAADVTGIDTPTTRSVLLSAREAIAQATTGTLAIALVTSPRHAPLWADLVRGTDTSEGFSLVELRRWDRASLRMWMQDTELPFQDEDTRGALLATTGGWPILVNEVIDAITATNTRPHHAVERVQTRLHSAEGATSLIANAGVSAQPQLGRVWGMLVDLNEPAFHDELTDLLMDEAGEPAGVLLDVLRTLGALDVTPDGRLRCEPVLAAAWRKSSRPA